MIVEDTRVHFQSWNIGGLSVRFAKFTDFPLALVIVKICQRLLKKWNSSVTLFNEFLPKSPVIKLLAKSLLEIKEELRIFLSKNVEI